MSSYGQLSLIANSASGFVAASAYTTPAASTTDMFEAFGSTSKVCRILQIDMSYSYGTSAPAVEPLVFLLRRTTANSSGTSTTETNIALDSTSGASTMVIKTYTANPTLGSSGGRILAGLISSPADNQTAQPFTSTAYINLYKADPTHPPLTLRGTGQGVVVNFNGIKPGGTPLLAFRILWTESDT